MNAHDPMNDVRESETEATVAKRKTDQQQTDGAAAAAVMDPPTDKQPHDRLVSEHAGIEHAPMGPALVVCAPRTINAEDGAELVAFWELPDGERKMEIRCHAIDDWRVYDTIDRDGVPIRHQNVRAAWVGFMDMFRSAALAWWTARAT